MNLTRFRRAAVMLGVIGCLLLALSGATAIPAAADSVLYAKPNATGAGDCTDWDNACTLQTALGLAGSGDEIWVAEGTHKPTTGTGRTATFQLKSGVGVYGGFAGTETSRDERDWALHETILSGDIGTVGNDSDNSYHVVTGSGTDATAVLDGFTITGGNADGSYPHYVGGGMYNDGGSPTLTNVTFSGNHAEFMGGGVYYYNCSDPTLTNVTFVGNSAAWMDGLGGGMANYGCDTTLTNVTFSGNHAYAYGGGMYNNGGFPTLINVTFSGNSAEHEGGGMCNWGGSRPTLTNVILWGNTAPFSPQIWNKDGVPTISYSLVQGCGGSGPGWDSGLGIDGDGNIDADPRFVDPNGFDNTVGTLDDNLRLRVTSPAIDAGDNGALPSGITFDLDGEPRFVDVPTVSDTGLGTPPIVDMGAYEAQPLPPPPPVPPAPEPAPWKPAPSVPTDPVPEWGSVALLGSGLAGMAGYAGLRMRRWKR